MSPAPLEGFHPIVQRWFTSRIGSPSEPQREGWPRIRAGKNVLIAAPTGSGKTLSAFLHCLDTLFRRALDGTLEARTHVLYVSPLKALGNDVQKNLLRPLEEIYELARAEGLDPQPVRVLVRSGDTPQSERQSMAKNPPHVLITTPESFYLCLTAARSREALRRVDTVIVDEIHALARDKRGSHFALSMERLKHLVQGSPQLIGLSATQRPLPQIASFLCGESPACEILEIGHVRPWELSVEVPDQELSAVASHEAWGQIYDRLVELSQQHRTMLIFANTRKLAERIAHDLGERIGHEYTAAHHGSLSRELRLAAEERLKSGKLRIMVATASLELGIDIGSVDLVVQIGTPRSIATFLQRVGRAGHHYGGVSRGILFAMTRDELVECTALLRAVRDGELDRVRIPEKGLDVLAQQIVAVCTAEEWREDELFALCKRAWPYRELTREEFERVLHMLCEGVSTRRGRSRVHLHRDRVNGILRARKGARITAVTNAGTIPETFTYPVVAEPEGKLVGTLDEDFAVESMAGDVFLLGSTAWRIQRVMAGRVHVESAAGQPPTVPFWLGEAPARTEELSTGVSRLREELVERPDAEDWLRTHVGLTEAAAQALVSYLRTSAAILGAMPSKTCVIAERFFDEAGGMQLILHAPFGGRINRAWGLALRKRFCRTFDFELQAAANDDGIILSLGEQHSFPLADIFDFLSPNNVEEVLTQAVLQAPMFGTRFRWVSARALALLRFRNGSRVPPPIQRANAEDLLAAVFPAQVGCQDNHGGAPIEVPDHPLVKETLDECLRDAMDVDGLKAVLAAMRRGEIRTRAVDLPEPSPLAHALLNSQPYTYLDDAPLEERRARAISVRRTLPAEDAASFGALDAAAITQVIDEARPPMRDAEELHDALLQLVVLPEANASASDADVLKRSRRAATLTVGTPTGAARYLVAAERIPHVQALYPDASLNPALSALPGDGPIAVDAAALAVVRGHMEVCGPTTAAELSAALSLPEAEIAAALVQLENEGQALRGTFRPASLGPAHAGAVEFCDRRLLQRIHRLTVGRLRKEIEPLHAQDFMRFLFKWHHLDAPDALRGRGGLLKAISLLQGYEAPAAAWEQWLLPARMHRYLPELLERACWEGEVAWGRLTLRDDAKPEVPGQRRGAAHPFGPAALAKSIVQRGRPPVTRNATITFVRREELDWMLQAARSSVVTDDGVLRLPVGLSKVAEDVAHALERRGACFFQDLVSITRRLPAEIEDALWELLSRGVVSADAVENLRVLQSPAKRKRQRLLRRGGPGRWSLLAPAGHEDTAALHERIARLLLFRYGIVWRDLAMREPLAPTWRELAFIYRRMEARGEIRGGRFVAGFVGEQFALPEAVDLARSVRRTPHDGRPIHLSAVDPLNLTGIVTPGPRVPAIVGQFVTYVDGVPQTQTHQAQATAS
ncbi:MAG: DEAD/DEAH box helicase [Myxococcaceae bacterium]|nr:DEAD/DEAH box helicase [Myxococcaceae bacterium]